jgi:ribonuclease P protein component
VIASGQPGAIFINCMRNTWNKAEKLKSRKRIDQVFKQGKSFSAFPFKVFYVVTRAGTAAPPPPVQAGFGAGSRHFKRAVDRNRIKRLCREAYRLQKQPLYDHLTSKGLSLALFFIYTGKDLPDYQTVSGKIGVILQKLVRETA